MKDKVSSTNRPASELEAILALNIRNDLAQIDAQIEVLKERKATISGMCTHKVFYDTAGYPFDNRFCAACGKYLGAI